MRKLLKKHGRVPRVLITDKLKSYAAANRDLGLKGEHRKNRGLNNRAENSHQPTRVREKVMRRFKSERHLQRFASVHDQVANLFMHCRYYTAQSGSGRYAPKPSRRGKALRAHRWWTASPINLAILKDCVFGRRSANKLTIPAIAMPRPTPCVSSC